MRRLIAAVIVACALSAVLVAQQRNIQWFTQTGPAANIALPIAIANGGTGTATTSAAFVFAGPISGGAAAPGFRLLVVSDIPSQVTAYSSAENSTTQSLSNGTDTALAYDTNLYDVGPVHSGTVNNTRFTVPTNSGGLWTCQAYMFLAAAATGQISIVLRLNGTTKFGEQAVIANNATVGSGITLPWTFQVVDSDYFEVIAFQNSGGSLNSGNAGNATLRNRMACNRIRS